MIGTGAFALFKVLYICIRWARSPALDRYTGGPNTLAKGEIVVFLHVTFCAQTHSRIAETQSNEGRILGWASS